MMEFKTAGGVKLPVLGLGTWQIGGGYSPDTTQDKEGIRAIQHAVEAGLTHIDTAEAYGAGHSEELVGEAIKQFKRKDLFITTKVSPEHLGYDDVLTSAKHSLERLQTDYIDLYLQHRPNPSIPIEETMKAMDELISRKWVKHIGVSNFTVEELEQAQRQTKNKIIANQVEYNLLVRNNSQFSDNVELEVLPYCQVNDLFLIAFRPVLKGKLTQPGIPVLDEVAKKYRKTQAQVALRWLIEKKNVVAIIKTSNPEHLQENLGALGWHLDPEDMKRLDELPEAA